jgi:acyl carrier protein
MSDTVERLKNLFSSRLKLEIGPERITADTVLFGTNGLGLDSLDVLELIVGIKKEFGVEIADRATAERVFTSIGTIAAYIEENK